MIIIIMSREYHHVIAVNFQIMIIKVPKPHMSVDT
jgi:hypothetical protein